MFSLKNRTPTDELQKVFISIAKEIDSISLTDKSKYYYPQNTKIMEIVSMQEGTLTVKSEFCVNEDCYIYLYIHGECSYFQYTTIKSNTSQVILSTFKLSQEFGNIDIKFFCGNHEIYQILNVPLTENKKTLYTINEDTITLTFKKHSITSGNILRFYKANDCLNDSPAVKEIKLFEGTIKMGLTFPHGRYVMKWFEEDTHKHSTPYHTSIEFFIYCILVQ
ncbi:hypothetical protein EDI_335930 [Entamoeba dispar SAW760]|uniref:Uncharacterized protein n=1 Tax=Entamoeba dispar (strain ATCC PRA-260 / SAW760) TaxID=370354 RepID=B0ERS0_ENTDS|nr:uncharacterized protein EDI_335930 [Entamoeba dispar SAW760]EDR22715.1 hypothetical protein EDI_335930 [Entamoeba dispar SAW760]|eukprot:EDR22715.1 hypothetical protein EDI_335930 [Entamoeba dispar SAW760]